MICPQCKTKLEKSIFYNVEVDYCPDCLGIFFEENEFTQAKDERDKELRWLDIDLWKDKDKLKVNKHHWICPSCQVPLYKVNYNDSQIKVNVCNVCKGIWLERGDFKKIIAYLKKKADYEILENYLKDLLEEAAEILIGPESFKDEVLDFLAILKLLKYKFLVHFPELSKLIIELPK